MQIKDELSSQLYRRLQFSIYD